MMEKYLLVSSILLVHHSDAYHVPFVMREPHSRHNAALDRGNLHRSVLPTFSRSASLRRDSAFKFWSCVNSGQDPSAFGDPSIPKGTGSDILAFRSGDAKIFREMSASEAAAGNVTGAARLDSIADRMDSIMQRSSSRMAAVVLDAPAAGEAQEANMWPFRSRHLKSNGRDLWKVSGDDAPHTAARMLDSFDGSDGGGGVWTVRINQLQGGAAFGLTTIDVDLDSNWCSPNQRGQVSRRLLSSTYTAYAGGRASVGRGWRHV
jgi:hypothetical protein